ncbi:hypothetical protein Bpfe_023279 [Biomphalaria pfeifferi]|uniref:Uncharacterized protein n=1 Tax=Biomphalaria pfeifferi TaxID=112525 RepID=A0AAD8B5Y6_BIOPF|nr:hypothetical protein Bpfe_023279 [Biomphalaria pfeifferi]
MNKVFIAKALIDTSDITGGTVTIQCIDRGTPPQVLPVARVHVECRYVHGTNDSAVLDTPVYDVILGSKYVPLGVVNKPYFSLPVGRSTKQKRCSNQLVGSPGRHTHTLVPTHQRSSNHSALALTLLGSHELSRTPALVRVYLTQATQPKSCILP